MEEHTGHFVSEHVQKWIANEVMLVTVETIGGSMDTVVHFGSPGRVDLLRVGRYN